MDLLEASRTIGSWCWRQARAFEVVGSWVQQEEHPEAKIQFFAHSRRQGAHAEALARLLPEIAGSDPSDLIRPADGDAALIGSLEEVSEGGTQARLEALYQGFSPQEIAGAREFLGQSSPVSAMPLIRAVAAVLADEEQDLRSGAALLATMRGAG